MSASRRAYEYEHVVGFQETNLVGNVYFAHPVAWQGRCREMFLRDEAPEILTELANGLQLLTARVSCEYLAEMRAFDRIRLRMRLGSTALNRIVFTFEYWRQAATGEELVARGEQEVVCMRLSGGASVATRIPEGLAKALEAYA